MASVTGFCVYRISKGPMALGMSRDRQRVLISPADGHPGPQISFSPEDLMYVFRVCTSEVGGLDRIRLYFKRPIGLTGVQMAPGKDKMQVLILYYDYSMVGVTDEQMELLEGMKKRKAEEPAEDSASPKKVKMLSGRPSRRAKEQALMSIANPMARGMEAEDTPEMRMKRSTVSRAVDAYMAAFRKVSPGARFSTFTMDAELTKAISVTMPGVSQVMEDPLFLMPSDEGGELLLTSRWNVNSHNVTIWASEVDFVLIAVENDEDEDEDDDDSSGPEVSLDNDEVDASNFALFMHLAPDGTVRTISVTVPTMVQLVQIRDWLKNNNIAYMSAMASMAAIRKVDLAALCREKPEEFDLDLDTKRVVGGPLDGFRPFEPYLMDSDDDDSDEDGESDEDEDDEDDELTAMEAKVAFEEMVAHAKKVAAIGNKSELIKTFTDAPKEEQTAERLEQIFREAGLWGFLADRMGNGDSSSDSDDDSESQEN